MATVHILNPERTNYLAIPAEPDTPNINLRATLQDLTNVARDLPTEEALRVEIENLCMATLTIDGAFYDIRRRLSIASNEQNRRVELYDTCHALETQWEEHHRTYQNLLWRSKEFAGEAQTMVDDFREIVLPSLRDRGRTRSEKQEMIQEQINVLEDASQPSQNLCQEFLNFGRALDTYIIEFSRVVEGLEIGEQRTTVSGLEDRMRSARDAMEVVSQEVKDLGWKFARDVAITGIAVLLAFVVPTWWVQLLAVGVIGVGLMNCSRSGLQFLEARRRWSLAVTEYESMKAEYDLERTCLGQMVQLESTLHDSRPLVQEVTVKLGMFASVWAAITADIRQLKNSLDRAGDPTSQLFILRVQRLERLYGYLSQALRHYQVTVRMPQ